MLSECFKSVFITRKDAPPLSEAVEVFIGEEWKRICDSNETKETINEDIDELKQIKTSVPDSMDRIKNVWFPTSILFNNSFSIEVLPPLWRKASLHQRRYSRRGIT